jgi:hypothetical protein
MPRSHASPGKGVAQAKWGISHDSTIYNVFRSAYLIVNGRPHRAAVPVVPRSLLCLPVTAGPGPAIPSYDLNAAFMSSQPHESGIHAVWSGAGEANVTEVRFRWGAAAGGETRAHQERIKISPS